MSAIIARGDAHNALVTFTQPDASELAELANMEIAVQRVMDECKARMLAWASHEPRLLPEALNAADEVYNPPGFIEEAGHDLWDVMDVIDENRVGEVVPAVEACLSALQRAALMLKEIGSRQNGYTDAPPIERADLATVIASPNDLPEAIEKNFASQPRGMMTWKALENDLAPSVPLVPGLIEGKATSVVYGLPGAQKTFFSLDLAMRVATGSAWRHAQTNGAGVVYVAAEGGAGLRRRIAAWRKHHGANTAHFVLLQSAFDLMKEKGTKEALDAICAWQVNEMVPVSLVIIDTLAKSIGGADENSGQVMTAVAGNLDRIRDAIGAHVMVITHAGKSAGHGPRGHGALAASVDTIIRIEPGLATVEKQRDGETGQTFAFRLAPVQIGTALDGSPIMSAVVEHEEASARKKAPTLDPLPLLVKAVGDASGGGSPFRLNRPGSIHQRRAELPEPLRHMGRDPLQRLARDAIAAGMLRNSSGILTVAG